MTKTEQLVIQLIVARLKAPNCGCAHSSIDGTDEIAAAANAAGIEAVSRLYLETWIVPALEMLLPGDGRNPELARQLAGS